MSDNVHPIVEPDAEQSRVSIASISAFLETKAASACSFDLAIWFCILGLIFVLHIGIFDELMNASHWE